MIYKIMIVDDENTVTDWVEHILKQRFEETVEINKCNNPLEALRVLKSGVIDIVLLDISMPVMTGLEIMQEIDENGLETLAVFLTAHDQFEYAQKAVNEHVVAYVLKNEPDEVLLDAVEEAMQRILDKIKTQKLIDAAKSGSSSLMSIYKRDILYGLLMNNELGKEHVSKLKEDILFNIDLEKPLYLLIAKANRSNDSETEIVMPKQNILIEAGTYIENVFEKDFYIETVSVGGEKFVWLIQPKNEENAYNLLLSDIERSQTWVSRYTGYDLKFLHNSVPIYSSELSMMYRKLSMLQSIAGEESHEVLTEMDLSAISGKSESSEHSDVFQYSTVLRRLLENGDKDEFDELLTETLAVIDDTGDTKDVTYFEACLSLSGMFLSYINQYELYQDIIETMPIQWIFQITYLGKEELSEKIIELSECLFNLQKKKRSNSSDASIRNAKEYIKSHLDEDLSLITIAEKVYLNPSYFSLLFKKKTGMNVSDYIKMKRLESIKEQLLDGKKKINEIAKSVGYSNAAYFSKFFKSKTGLTPLEFRNNRNN